MDVEPWEEGGTTVGEHLRRCRAGWGEPGKAKLGEGEGVAGGKLGGRLGVSGADLGRGRETLAERFVK